MKQFLTAIFLLALVACGGQGNTPVPPSPTPPPPTPPTGGSNPTVTQLVNSITQLGTVSEVVDATKSALQAGGIAFDQNDTKAKQPIASWYADSASAFNMANEARGRQVSGRFTVADLGQMWKDFDFPFQGTGTPGQQLLGFLRGWLEDAKAKPNDPNSFTPLFIEAMVAKQVPSVNLADPKVRPDDVRLSLLEIELLIAAFDRAYQPVAGTQSLNLLPQDVGADNCTEFKALFGKMGGKAIDKAVVYIRDFLSGKAIQAMGLSEAEVSELGGSAKSVLSSLGLALKLIKLVQLYARNDVLINVEGSVLVHKPHKGQARKLVPVTVKAGIPEQDWQNYQQNLGSSNQQTLYGCLKLLGIPEPLDLKEVAKNTDKWRAYWDLIKGSPKHARIPSDVNNFDAPGGFGMKMVSDSASTSKATLKVDINDEPELATIFDGPVEKADVTVKASMDTSEPPSPAMLVQLGGLVGAIPTLVDLSAGWFKSALPPSNTITFQVEYHRMPDKIEASMDLTMDHDFGSERGKLPPQLRFQVKALWNATLNRQDVKDTAGTPEELFQGSGVFQYQSSKMQRINQEPNDKCTYTYQVEPANGEVIGNVGPAFGALTGRVVPDEGQKFNLGIGEDSSKYPKENIVLTTACPGPDGKIVTTVLPPETGRYFVLALNAVDILEEGTFLYEGTAPGHHPALWNKKPDGSFERTFNQPQTVSVVGGGSVIDTNVRSQNTVLKLKPIFAPPQP
jgi:hypothetical protein